MLRVCCVLFLAARVVSAGGKNTSLVAVVCPDNDEVCDHAFFSLSLRNLTGIRVNRTSDIYGKGYGAVILKNEDDAFELATKRGDDDDFIVLAPESVGLRSGNESMLLRNSITDTHVAEAARALVSYYQRMQFTLIFDSSSDAETNFLLNDDALRIIPMLVDTPLSEDIAEVTTASIDTQMAVATLTSPMDQSALFRAVLRRDPVTFILTDPQEEAFYTGGTLDVETALGGEGALGLSRVEPDLPAGYLDQWAQVAATNCSSRSRRNLFSPEEHRQLEEEESVFVSLEVNSTQDDNSTRSSINSTNSSMMYVNTNNITSQIMKNISFTPELVYCDQDNDLSTLASGASYWIEAIWLYADANGDYSALLTESFDTNGDTLSGQLDIVNAQLQRTPRLSAASYVDVGDYSISSGNISIDDDALILFLEDDDLVTTQVPMTPVPTWSPTTIIPTLSLRDSGSSKKSNGTVVIPVLALAVTIFICALCATLCAARTALARLERKQRMTLVSSLHAFEVVHDFDPDQHGAVIEKELEEVEDGIPSDNVHAAAAAPAPPLRVVCKSGARTRQGREYVVQTQRLLSESNDTDDTRSIRKVLEAHTEDEEAAEWRMLECWYWEAETSSLSDFDEIPPTFFIDEKKPSVSWIGYDDLAQDQISSLWHRFKELPAHVRDELRRKGAKRHSSEEEDEEEDGSLLSTKDIDPSCYTVILRGPTSDINLQDLEDENQPFLAASGADDELSPRSKAARGSVAVVAPPESETGKHVEPPPFHMTNNEREINLATMTQTNLATGRVRRIKMEADKRSVRLIWLWRENFRNLQKWRTSQVTLNGTLWVKYNDVQVQRALTDAYLHYDSNVSSPDDASADEKKSETTIVLLEQLQQQRDQVVRLDAHNELAEALTEAKYTIDTARLVQINSETNFRRAVCLLLLTKYERDAGCLAVATSLFGGATTTTAKKESIDQARVKSLPNYTLESTSDRQSSARRLSVPTPSAVWTSLTTPSNLSISRSKAGADTIIPLVIPKLPSDISVNDCLKLTKDMLVSVIYDHESEDWSYGREIMTNANKVVHSNEAGWFPKVCVEPATGLSVSDLPDRALQDFSFLLPPRHWNCAQPQIKRLARQGGHEDEYDEEQAAYEAEEPTLVDVAGTREAKEVLSVFDLDYFNVVEVLRVENLQLWRPYATKRLTTLEAENALIAKNQQREHDEGISPSRTKKKKIDNSVIEKYPVFHGTTNDAAHKIAIEGFNRDFSSASHSQHGKGANFSTQAAHACFHTFAKPDDKGIQHVLVCRIVSGRYTTGTPGLVAPPFRPDAPHRRYDSTVDDPEDPAIFVTYSDYQAYPDYIVKLVKKSVAQRGGTSASNTLH